MKPTTIRVILSALLNSDMKDTTILRLSYLLSSDSADQLVNGVSIKATLKDNVLSELSKEINYDITKIENISVLPNGEVNFRYYYLNKDGKECWSSKSLYSSVSSKYFDVEVI